MATPDVEADITDPRMRQKVAQEEAETYFYWKTLRHGAGITELWSQPHVGRDISKNEGGGWPLRQQYQRITAMARAYVGSNGPLGFADKMQGNADLLKDILYALHFFHQYRYNERTKNKLGADWIANEISQPLEIASAINLLRPHFTQDFIDKQVATFTHMAPTPLKMYGGAGATTGFNRLYACYAWAHRGLMNDNGEMIAFARDAIADEYMVNNRSKPIVRAGKTSYDGFYEDGSFIQHGAYPYIGIYGRGVLEYFGKLKGLLEQSPWRINDPRSQVFNRWVLEGYAPLFFNGQIVYGSLGRSSGQSWHQNGAVSSEIMNAVAPLIPLADASDTRERLAGVLRTWMIDKQQCAFPQFNQLDMERVSIGSYAILQGILADQGIRHIRPKPGTYVFHNSDYVIHHQPDFAVQLRMFSARTKTHENLHQGTNMRGWYQGEGTLFVYNRDNSRYNDNFWPTIDPCRLPGTTVDTRTRDPLKDGGFSESPWAGGVSLDGFGMASMGLDAVDATLTAKKSWFFLDDQIVCLGADINSSDNRPIETTIENTKLYGEGDNILKVNGRNEPSALGWKTTLKDVKWAHLAGTVPGTDLAWVFPKPADLQAKREARTGTWTDSFKRDKNEAEHIRNYLTLWYDHGDNPTGATYAHIVLPGRTAEQTEQYAEAPEVRILANNADLQAVSYPAQSLTAATVWTDKATTVNGLTVTGRCNVIVIDDGKQVRLAVSDPTQQAESLALTWTDGVSRTVEADPAITVESLKPLRLILDVRKADGRPLRARFAR